MIAKLFTENQDKLKKFIRGSVRDEHDVRELAQTAWNILRRVNENGRVNSADHACVLLYQIAGGVIAKHHKVDAPRTRWDILNDLGYDEQDVFELLDTVRSMPEKVRLIYDGLCEGKQFAEIGEADKVSAKCVAGRWFRFCKEHADKQLVTT